MFGVVSLNFVAVRHPFRKPVSGCIQSTCFCHRNHLFVFRNEHAHSTTLGPKLMVWVVSRNFVVARHPFRKRVSGVHKSTSFCHRNHFFVFHNEHAQSTTLGPKLMFGVVSRNFVATRHPFRKQVSGCIEARVFTTTTISSFFRNEHAQSTTLGPNSCLGWFRAILLPHVTHSKNGCRGAFKARVFPPEPFLRFSQRTCPLNYLKSKTHVLGGFAQFHCRTSLIPKTGVSAFKARVFATGTISSFSQRKCPIHFGSKTHVWGGFTQFRCRTSPILKTGVGVHSKHEFLPPEPFLRFSQRTCPLHYFRSKTHGLGGFAQFRYRTSPIPKTGVWVHSKHGFFPPESFLRFSQRTCPIHYFGSKTHVWGGFTQFCCHTSPIPKTGVGLHSKHEFLPPEPFLRFSQQTCPLHYFR
jgi:hypothetical protein